MNLNFLPYFEKLRNSDLVDFEKFRDSDLVYFFWEWGKNENTFWDYPTFKANKAWCSTKVDESGKHVNGERMFGICGNGCPFPENEGKFWI